MYWITGLLGAALVAAPWVLGYSDNQNALWTSVIVGAVVVLVSGYKGLAQDTEQTWEYWVAGLAGVAAIVAPFVLGFNGLTAALVTSLVVGVLVLLLSGYEVLFAEPAR